MRQVPLIDDPRVLFTDYSSFTKTIVTGMSLCGKSTIGQYIQHEIFGGTRNVIIDAIGEYKTEKYIKDIDSFVAFFKKNWSVNFGRLVFRTKGMSEKERYLYIDVISKLCYDAGNVHLMVEEAHKFCSPHSIPDNFGEVFTEGRHNIISCTTTTQRLSAVHPVVSGQSTKKFCGMLDTSADLSAATNLFIDCRENILNLKQYEFLAKSNNQISQFKTDKLRLSA